MEINTIILGSKVLCKAIEQINHMLLIDEFRRSNRTCIEKLDKLDQKMDSIIMMDLKAAQKCFEDFQKADAFAKNNMEFLKNIFRKYQGLSLKGETEGVSNKRIAANSYLGLLLLENMCENKNEVLIARYIFHMFEADPYFSKKCFPDIHQEFFQPICDKISEGAWNDMEFAWRYRIGAALTEEYLKYFKGLLTKYDVSMYISDWSEGAASVSGRAAGILANKLIGPVHLRGDNFLQIMMKIRKLSSPGGAIRELVEFVIMGLNKILQVKIPKFTEKYILEQLQKAATEYLKAIDSEHISGFSVPSKMPAKSKKK